MILVLASSANSGVAAFVNTFTDAAASIFTCYDIAASKSSLKYPNFERSIITVQNKTISVKNIAGVINLLPAVFPNELFFYPPEEREYQSAEFHALLTFFLSSVTCPVINKPSSLSLNGPFINPMSWFHIAYTTGIPLSQLQIKSANPPDQDMFQQNDGLIEATFLAGKIISPTGTVADKHTITLASEANVKYLTAFYEYDSAKNLRFVRARTIPDIKNPFVTKAFADYFNSKQS